MNGNAPSTYLLSMLRRQPQAYARIRGSDACPGIAGTVFFYQTVRGAVVAAEVSGLPHPPGRCASGIFAFHIHAGPVCSGTPEEPFADALSHYDPGSCPHPYHAGDLPPLFGNSGYAFQVFLTDRFSVREILGKTVILHANPDDFTTQPAGKAGQRIACGEIRAFGR